MLITLTLCESQTWSTTNTLRYQLFTWLIFFFFVLLNCHFVTCFSYACYFMCHLKNFSLIWNQLILILMCFLFFFLYLISDGMNLLLIHFFFFKQLKRKKSMFPIWYTVKMGKNYSLKTGCSESRCKPGCSESLLQLYMREEQRRKQRSIYDF